LKLNHVSLPVADVRATRVFFERYFGFRCTIETGAERFVGLTDNAGMLLTISNLDGVGEVVYPKSFHFGFRKDADDQVDDVYERLKADGFAVGERENMHGAWTFYLTAPGGFTVEVMHQK